MRGGKEKVTKYSKQDEVMAVILGKLVHDFGQIQQGKVNNLLKEIGASTEDLVDFQSLREWAEFIQEDEELYAINEKAVNGDIDLGNIVVEVVDEEGVLTEEAPMKDINIDKVLSPAIKEHERVLSQNREFRRIQKEGSYLKILMEDLKEELLQETPPPDIKKPPLKQREVNGGKGLIIQHSDWHIGATIPSTVDYAYGYNWEIFQERLAIYQSEVIEVIQQQKPEEVLVLHNGDIIEQIFMRNVNQAFETEFNLSEQIAKAYRVIYDMLDTLAEHTELTFGMVGGNHDRLQANKKDDIFNQSAAYIVLDLLLADKERGLLSGVDILDNRDNISTFTHDIAGKTVYVVHGDNLPRNSKNPIANLIKDGNIDLLLTGHVHNFSIGEESYGRMHIVSSSIMGANSYSEQHNFGTTKPSQNMILLDKNLRGPVIYPVYFD